MRSPVKSLLVVTLLAAPLATWACFKPIRVLAPQLVGLQCPTASICIDDPALLQEASGLEEEAVSFVEAELGPMQKIPRLVFCSTQACARKFGFTNNGAYNVGTVGVVVGPRGWKPYFVRHELIHHVQMERLGTWHAWLHSPTWLIEGMAYSMSQDPRHPLPEPLESYRARFESWHGNIKHADMWAAAAEQ